MDKHQNLLKQVGFLLKSYDKIAKVTGENFNIFSVMGMESNEVKTHSAIIGHLLDPSGNHGLGNKPLELFIAQIIPKYENKELLPEEKLILNRFNIHTESCKATVEEHVGKISDDHSEGGRIDIIVKDRRNKAIVIENKIYAGEQKKQLIRYSNAYPNAPIIFLTLDGHDSNSTNELDSTNDEITIIDLDSRKILELNKDYFLVSYEKDILEWLENCLKEAVKFPMLREVLQQYIYLIKKLTNQTLNTELKMEIKDLIKSNYLAAAEISKNFNDVKLEIVAEFWKDLGGKIKEKLQEKNWLVRAEEFTIENHLNYLLISNETSKGKCQFYLRYSSNNYETLQGIMIDPLYKHKILKDVTGIEINEEMKLQVHKAGKISIVYLRSPFLNFKDNQIIAKITSNDDRQKLINESTDLMINYVKANIELFQKICEHMASTELRSEVTIS